MSNANSVLQYEGQERDDEAVEKGLAKEADHSRAENEQRVSSPR